MQPVLPPAPQRLRETRRAWWWLALAPLMVQGQAVHAASARAAGTAAVMSPTLVVSGSVATTSVTTIPMARTASETLTPAATVATAPVRKDARLRLDQAINAALASSPEVGVAVERAIQAREGVSEAFGERLPQVDLSLSAGREYNNPAGGQANNVLRGDYSDANEAKVVVQQLLFNGGRTRAEVRRRENILVGSNHRAVLIRYRIAQQTVETFLNIYEGQQSLAFVDLFVRRLEDLSAKMDLYAEEGNASKTLQKYVSSRLANARQARVQLLNTLQGDVENYRFLTETQLDLEKTKLVLIQPPKLQPFEAYRDAAKRFNPELQAAVADLQAAREDVRKGVGTFFPTVNLHGEYDTNRDLGGQTDDIRAAELKVEMNYRLFDGLTRNAALRRLKSQAREKELLVERVRRKNEQVLTQSWQALQARMEQEKLVRQELADSADVRNLRQQEFEEGEGDLVRLVETEEKLFAAARQKLRVDSDILLSRFELEFTSGQPDLSGPELPLPYASFDTLTSYGALESRKAQAVPLAAVSGTVPVSASSVLPVSMTIHVPVSDTQTVSASVPPPVQPTPQQVKDAAQPERTLPSKPQPGEATVTAPEVEPVAKEPLTPQPDRPSGAPAVNPIFREEDGTGAAQRLVIPQMADVLPRPRR